MALFRVLNSWSEFDTFRCPPGFYLVRSSWDDYTFKTTFSLTFKSFKGEEIGMIDIYEIGNVKIGYQNQEANSWTYHKIPKEFNYLGGEFFSLAESPEFYENLYNIDPKLCLDVLGSLNSVVLWSYVTLMGVDEKVLNISLMRDVNINTIYGQFDRIVKGHLTKEKFNFDFVRDASHNLSGLKLSFKVDHQSLPASNVHAIIGRNGLGKTTLLNEMVNSLAGLKKPEHAYFQVSDHLRIQENYFSTVVSVSFSAFDPFRPPEEQSDQKKGTCYYYIGLKLSSLEINDYFPAKKPKIYKGAIAKGFSLDEIKDGELTTISYLRTKYANSVTRCFSNSYKKELWIQSIKELESDYNFRDLNLTLLAEMGSDEAFVECIRKMKSMSSGHLVVFMTISRLVEVLQDKSLVIFDEPEAHLHPPLLSAFIRTLSGLLTQLNGVAILATHSPVVLQEVPRNCSWVLRRFGDVMDYNRPLIETFAEDVGVITKEVFQLEAERSGFVELFKEKVNQNLTYEEILRDFSGNIGYEGKALLRSMIMVRDRKPSSRGENA